MFVQKHKLKEKTSVLILSFFFAGWLGAMSTSVSLFISPLVIGLCRRKSTRLTAVMGGLITALGCLFTSFASQFHQLFFSYGMMIGKICIICILFFVHRLVYSFVFESTIIISQSLFTQIKFYHAKHVS